MARLKGINKVRDIAFSKVRHLWDESGYSDQLTPAEFLHLVDAGASSLMYHHKALKDKKAGIGGRRIYRWIWTKNFSRSYWDWRIPRLGEGG